MSATARIEVAPPLKIVLSGGAKFSSVLIARFGGQDARDTNSEARATAR
jgi:hypothetical protein